MHGYPASSHGLILAVRGTVTPVYVLRIDLGDIPAASWGRRGSDLYFQPSDTALTCGPSFSGDVLRRSEL